MPEKRTVKRARRKARAGKAPTTQAGERATGMTLWNFLVVVAALASASALAAPDTDALRQLEYWEAPVRDPLTVAAAERALRAEGYDAGPADGTLDARSVQALKQAQKDRELEPTGTLDRRTAAALGIDVEGNGSVGASAPR
jgi:peptidoglycan hydrolase-like protein with peptidoglycan-binding domain